MIVSGAFGLIGIEDGIGYEDIYTLTTGGTAPSKPASENVNDYVPSGWYASPQSVTSTKRYQWVCKRSKKNGAWSAWSTPVEYNRYVEDGTDGVGYEYCYQATQYNVTPSTPTSSNVDGSIPSGWYSTPPSISATNAYIWESQRTKNYGTWSSWSTPKLKNRWAYDGIDGANGDKGAKMRMRTWESSENYMQGAEGEEFYDIVVYGTQLYLCIKSHYSSASNAPNVSTTYWESAQQWTFVATQLLLAEKINASMIDADGITAKDADISGKITATSGTLGKMILSVKDAEDGLYYIDEIKKSEMALRPNNVTGVSYNVFDLEPSFDQYNLLLYLKRSRGNTLDRALYVEGIAEVYGRLGVGRSGAAGFSKLLPALVAEGISVYGQFCLQPLFVNSDVTLQNETSLVFIEEGSVHVTLPTGGLSDGQIVDVYNISDSTYYSTVKGKIRTPQSSSLLSSITLNAGVSYKFVYMLKTSKWLAIKMS